MTALAALALALTLYGTPSWSPVRCEPAGAMRITGYVKGAPGLSDRTYDGTSVWTREKIAAASWNIPLDTLVQVRGLDFTYRIADRGQLGNSGWLDILVDDRATAYRLEEYVGGKYAETCIVRWGPGR